MKKNLMILAVAAFATFTSCTRKQAPQSETDKNTTNIASKQTNENANIDLATIAGTYEGTFPAADCPGIKTVLTIKADSTYQFEQNYIDRKDGHDEASGVFRVLDNKVLMLVRPSGGEPTYFKVKDANNLVLTDSVGNAPQGDTAKFYVLNKKS